MTEELYIIIFNLTKLQIKYALALLGYAGLASAGVVSTHVGTVPLRVRWYLNNADGPVCSGGPFTADQEGTTVAATSCPDKIAGDWTMLCNPQSVGDFAGSYVTINGKRYCNNEDFAEDSTTLVIRFDAGEMPKHRWMRAGQ